ncbi:MAG TPA: tRNA (adenosine(37)-N6)-dimethylallyltransferase MiaA [Actinomycetota bacterium]|jgi:tRNA dimethylallyltransferase|nr:tRNA (adenosine(37)-N6)-dimethylallyltransferase MiaA [Actinomycetota bacterium]
MAVPVAAIVGATGVGKTKVSLAVAPHLDAEIVSVDSMQIYRGLDIGTAKPGAPIRSDVPHHLIDLFDPSYEVTVAEFQKLGRAAIADVTARGKRPLLVGGSGLYFRAVVDDLRFPPRSVQVRQQLESEIEAQGAAAVYERLAVLDPPAAAKIDPRNARRIARALEVIEVTGRPFSESDAWEKFDSIYDLRLAGLTLAREKLFARLEVRVDAMLDGGLIEEARALQGAGIGRSAGQALGYRQILEAPAGRSHDQIRDDILAATKRFARRQESWFRSDPRVVWFEADEPGLVDRLVAFFRRPS